MKKSEAITINYAPKQARIANAWKKWIGQIDGLKRGDAITVKQNYEKQYTKDASSKPEWKNEYASIVDALNSSATQGKEADFAYNMFIEYAYVGAEFFKLTRALEDELEQLEESGEKASPELIKNSTPQSLYEVLKDKISFKTLNSLYLLKIQRRLIYLESRPHG